MATPICSPLLHLPGYVIHQVRPCIQAKCTSRCGKYVGTSLTTFEAYDGASSNLSFTPRCFLVDGSENPRSVIELSQVTCICVLSVRRLRPSFGIFPFSCIVSSILSVQYLMKLRASFVCAHTDAAFDRGLVNALFIALG